MNIVRTYKVTDIHGAEGYQTCEHCNRKVKTISLMSDGSLVGKACGKTIAANSIRDQVEAEIDCVKRIAICRAAGLEGYSDYQKSVKK